MTQQRSLPHSPVAAERGAVAGVGEKPASGTLERIPVVDLGPCLAGAPGALDAAAAGLRSALENVGFFYVIHHGIDESLIDRAFAETRRFHAQPLDEKMKIHLNASHNGYMPLRGHAQRHSPLNRDPKPNENESFFAKREIAPDDPALRAGNPFIAPNQWPADLPGFRETVVEYHTTLTGLAFRMLPIFERALDLPADFLRPSFAAGGKLTVRMIHYPPAKPEHLTENVFGTAAHTDRNLFTILAAGDTPGLEIYVPGGGWLQAPVMPGAFVVNSGDTLRRWTNDRFLSTPHRVLNVSGRDRYSIAFFVATDFDAVIECLPTCRRPDDPPRYPPTTYGEMYTEFINANYAYRQQDGGAR